MADLITTHIATALVTGATAALSDGARALVSKLANLVRERFRRNPSDQDTLAAATRNPHDGDTIQRLADLLEAHMRQDPAFARQLRSLWTDFAVEVGHRDEVTNTVNGPVRGNVVQARDVQGGISFGHAPPADGQPG